MDAQKIYEALKKKLSHLKVSVYIDVETNNIVVMRLLDRGKNYNSIITEIDPDTIKTDKDLLDISDMLYNAILVVKNLEWKLYKIGKTHEHETVL